MAASDSTTRRSKAKRLRSETDELIREITREALTESGLLDLVLFGSIEITVSNGQIKNIYIKPLFVPSIHTAELTQ